MKNVIIILIFILGSSLCAAQIEIMKKFDLGDYSVGFKDERITDYSRAYEDGYRSIQLFVWYPAKESSVKALQYEQYFMINNPKGKLPDSNSPSSNVDTLVQREINGLKKSVKVDIKFSKYKALKTIAKPEAPILEGNYPLILFAPGGNTSSHLNSVICEYLASHGYIVVSIPSLGHADSLRWPFNQIGLNLQIDDMAFVINHLKRTMSQVNIDKTGLMAWSVGGVSQGIYCMKNPNIDLFISLDSGLGRVYGVNMLKESHYFDYDKFRIPYLHMTGKQPEMYLVERSTEFADSIASKEKHSLVIEPFAHQHFAAQLGIIPAMASEIENKSIIDGYINMSRLSLVFSNIHLKDDASAKQEWLEMIKEYSSK